MNVRRTLEIFFILYLMFATPALAAVKLDGFSLQNGVSEVQKTEPLNGPLMRFLLLSAGIVFFLGLIALIKCGGASFGGIIVGAPHSAADGFIGMSSCIIMGIALVSGISLYLSWM